MGFVVLLFFDFVWFGLFEVGLYVCAWVGFGVFGVCCWLLLDVLRLLCVFVFVYICLLCITLLFRFGCLVLMIGWVELVVFVFDWKLGFGVGLVCLWLGFAVCLYRCVLFVIDLLLCGCVEWFVWF